MPFLLIFLTEASPPSVLYKQTDRTGPDRTGSGYKPACRVYGEVRILKRVRYVELCLYLGLSALMRQCVVTLQIIIFFQIIIITASNILMIKLKIAAINYVWLGSMHELLTLSVNCNREVKQSEKVGVQRWVCFPRCLPGCYSASCAFGLFSIVARWPRSTSIPAIFFTETSPSSVS